MKIKNTKNRSLLMRAALEQIPCDLTIKNVQFVNVFTGEVYKAEIDILDGYVVKVREEGISTTLPSKKILDGENLYLIPGFIDTHMHVESSMMIPENLSRAVVPWGTTTVCTDPHEIANVLGINGVRFMIENAKNSSLRQYVLAPSCVPAVPGIENSGAVFLDKEMETLLDMDEVIGIAELMDYVGVYTDSDRMHKIIEKGLEKDAFLQGHAPFVTGKELAAYKIGGPCSDHESETSAEILEKLRVGMHINLRASSLANHLKNLVDGMKTLPYHDYISICTDDVHAKDLIHLGHVNKVVRYAIESGLDAIDVIRMSTLNAARELGLTDLGAIAPGYHADFQLVSSLDGVCPSKVFINGKLVAENGNYIQNDLSDFTYNPSNTIQTSWISDKSSFSMIIDMNVKNIDVNVMVPLDETNILRTLEVQTLPVHNKKISLNTRKDLAFVSVINRHGLENMCVSIIQNYGLKDGAFGTTISHDSHNVVIIYKTEEDALCVLRKLEEMGGGMCASKNGQIIGALALPFAGLMSEKSCTEVAEEFEQYTEAFYTICDKTTPIMSASIMSLTALPGVVITDCGLVNGDTQKILA